MSTGIRKEASDRCRDEKSGAGIRKWRPNPLDIFAIINLTLFAVLISSVYWERFLRFKSRANLPEFIAYAALLMGGMVILWIVLRPLHISVLVLLACQVGLLLHFAGGLSYPGGMRLYDYPIDIYFFDYLFRFDKIVHFVNSIIGCIVTLEIARLLKFRIPRVLSLVVILVVVGTGALIEIVEYVVVKTVPHNGVGDYDNNMTDLLANLFGCLTFAALWSVKPMRRMFPSPDQEP
jgi:hypothetical protein